MAKISSYTSDSSLAGTEKLIGTDTDGTTLNYSLSDIATKLAGSGLTATSGVLSVDSNDAITAGTGIDISSGTVSVDVSDFMSNGTDDYILTATGTDAFQGEANLQFNSSNVFSVSGTQTITSTTADQFKILYNSTNYALMNVSSTGDLEIETIGAGSTDSDITLNADGGIYLNADNATTGIVFADATNSMFWMNFASNQIRQYKAGDTDDYFVTEVTTNGATTIATVDAAAAAANITLQPDGKLICNAVASDEAVFNETGADVDFRVESDNETHMIFVEGSTDRVSIGDSVDSPAATLEVTNNASAGAYNVPLVQLNSNDTDQIALDINAANIDENVVHITANAATTTEIFNISSSGLTTGRAVSINDDSSNTGTRNTAEVVQSNASATGATALMVKSVGGNTGMLLDKNAAGDAAQDAVALHLDFDRTVASSGTNAHNDVGINLDLNSASLGTSTAVGLDIDVVGATSGTHTATGMEIDVSGSDTNYGMKITSASENIRLFDGLTTDDFLTIDVYSGGNSTIATVNGGDDTSANLNITLDGTMRVRRQSADTFIFKHNQNDQDLTFTQYDDKEVARIHDGGVVPTASGTSTSLSAGTGFGNRRRVLTLGSGNDDNILTLTAADSGAIIYVTPTNAVKLRLPTVGTETGMWFDVIIADKINKAFIIETTVQDGADNIAVHNIIESSTAADIVQVDVGAADHDQLTFTNALEGSRIEIINCAGGSAEKWFAYVRSGDTVLATVA